MLVHPSLWTMLAVFSGKDLKKNLRITTWEGVEESVVASLRMGSPLLPEPKTVRSLESE